MNRINKKVISFLVVLMLIIVAIYIKKKRDLSSHKWRIGLVTPAPHPALEQIISGFRQSVIEKMGDSVELEVQNAQGDAHLQSTLIRAFLDKPVDLLVTISTRTTQMAISQTEQPILFLSAEVHETKRKNQVLLGINDDINLETHFALLQKSLPAIKKLTIVYSVNEKIIPEVEKFAMLCQQAHITLQKVGVQSLPELSSAWIDEDTDGIFVLKDVLVTNGIQVLVKKANQLQKPLLASDEVSVSVGACFALGVKEQDIGKQGGELAVQFLQNPAPYQAKFLVTPVNNIQIFSNPKACQEQKVDMNALQKAAALMHFPIRVLPEENQNKLYAWKFCQSEAPRPKVEMDLPTPKRRVGPSRSDGEFHSFPSQKARESEDCPSKGIPTGKTFTHRVEQQIGVK